MLKPFEHCPSVSKGLYAFELKRYACTALCIGGCRKVLMQAATRLNLLNLKFSRLTPFWPAPACAAAAPWPSAALVERATGRLFTAAAQVAACARALCACTQSHWKDPWTSCCILGSSRLYLHRQRSRSSAYSCENDRKLICPQKLSVLKVRCPGGQY